MNYFNDDLIVKDIKIENYDFVRVIPQVNYIPLSRMCDNLPKESECRKRDIWVAERDCKITIVFKSGLRFKYTIKKGYVTDFASVPKICRNIISNDDVSIIIGAIVHDANYGCHWLDFSVSNTLFRSMLKYHKMGLIKRNLAYNAVKYFAKSHFITTKESIDKEKEYVNFKWDLVK